MVNIEGGGKTCLADYKVGRKPVGKGKFSVVYKSILLKDGSACALKKISIDLLEEKSREKCLKEVGLIQSLQHENIIQYKDAFVQENQLIIVFEWAGAGDLKRQIRKAREQKQRFHERVIWKYFLQICSAVKYMHSKRIIHRDIKPANIFVTTTGTVKVGDLGLSRFMSVDTLEAFSKVGTPLYMSPEVLKNEGYGFQSDIWSLGCILYELGVLTSPFKEEGISLVDLFKKISTGKYTPFDPLLPYSEDFKTLARSMLELDPGKRPTIDQVCSYAGDMLARFDDAQVSRAGRQEESSRPSPREEPTQRADDGNVIDLLNCLDFDKHVGIEAGRIHRLYFTMEMNRRNQFVDFTRIMSWLLECLGIKWVHDEMQSPFVNVNSLLVAVDKAGVCLPQVNSSQLTGGFGKDVCLILQVCAKEVLKQRNGSFQLPQYIEEDADNEEIHVASTDSELPEDISDDEYDADLQAEVEHKRIILPMLGNPSLEAAQEWKLELERIRPRLGKPLHTDATWASRTRVVKSCSEKIQALERGFDIKLYQEQISEIACRIENGEQRIRKRFTGQSEQMKRLQRETEQRLGEYTTKKEVVDALLEKVEGLDEKIEEVESTLDQKANTLCNVDPIKQMRTALQRLERDIREMDMKTALLLLSAETAR